MPMENNLQLDNLMKEGTFPVESVGGDRWRILHGDTLQLVQAFQPGIFDALITDPPYASGGTKQPYHQPEVQQHEGGKRPARF